MKNSFKLFAAALMALAMFMPVQANEQLTICDEGAQSPYVPFWNIDYQSNGMHSQFIYPAAMLAQMNGEAINSFTFYLKGTDGILADGGKLVIKIGETDVPTYANASDFREVNTVVAGMPLQPGVTELTVIFPAPYEYHGGNLVVDFTNPEVGGENWFGWNYWLGASTSGYTAIGSNGMMYSFLPKVTFDYGVLQEWEAMVDPLELNFNIPAEREEVQTITLINRGQNAFTPVIGSVDAPLYIDVEPVELATGESLEIPVKFAPNVEITGNAELTIDCGQAGSFVVKINFTATAPIYEVTVGDRNDNYNFLPIYSYYMDEVGTYGQMIYTEEMMGDVKDNKITKVTFYPTRALSGDLANGEIQLSFKKVEENGFSTSAPITEMTAVANYTVEGGETLLEFVLDEPYLYNGGSLAIEALCVHEVNHFAQTYFFGNTLSGYYPSLYHFSSTTSRSYFLPMATFTYDKAQTPPQPEEWQLGDVNHDHAVNVADVTDLIKYILTSGSEPVEFYIEQANVDGIDQINVADVTALIQKILQN